MLSLPTGKIPVALGRGLREAGPCVPPPPHTTEAWGEFSQPLGVEAAGLGELQPLQVLLEDLPSLLQRTKRMCGCGGHQILQKGGIPSALPKAPGQAWGGLLSGLSAQRACLGLRRSRWPWLPHSRMSQAQWALSQRWPIPAEASLGPAPPNPALPSLSTHAFLPWESKGSKSLLRWPPPFSPKAVAFITRLLVNLVHPRPFHHRPASTKIANPDSQALPFPRRMNERKEMGGGDQVGPVPECDSFGWLQ